MMNSIGTLLTFLLITPAAQATGLMSLLTCEQVFIQPASELQTIDRTDPNLEHMAANERFQPGFIDSFIRSSSQIHWVNLEGGLSFRFAFFPARKSPASSPTVRYLDGLESSLETTLQKEAFIKAQTENHNLLIIELPGLGLPWLKLVIDSGFKAPGSIPLDWHKRVLLDGMVPVTEIVAQNYNVKLSGDYIDQAISWSAWPGLALVAQKTPLSTKRMVHFSPQAESLHYFFLPGLKLLEHMVVGGEQTVEAINRFLPGPRMNLFASMRHRSQRDFRTQLKTQFYAKPRLHGDAISRAGALARTTGLYRLDGIASLRLAPADLQYALVIAEADEQLPPAILADLAQAALDREGGKGEKTTTVVLLRNTKHKVIDEAHLQKPLAQVTAGEIGPGFFEFKDGEFKPMDRAALLSELRGPLFARWPRLRLMQMMEDLKGLRK